MRFALFSPGFGSFADPRVLRDLARRAEGAGWHGYFLWDHILFGYPDTAPIGDPWVTLSAMATATEQLIIGTVVTPIPRRHPWKLAREAVSLDHLSGGRTVLGLGIGGDFWGREFSAFGQVDDDHLHAEMLDEGLDVLPGLWTGQPFSYEGKHYKLRDVTFRPVPVQQPRIPIWLAGTWPFKRPFRRAARWDGVVPQPVNGGTLTLEDFQDIRSFIEGERGSMAGFDVVRIAPLPDPSSPPEDGIEAYEAAGVTWWLQPIEDDMGPPEQLHKMVEAGPPRQLVRAL